MMKRKISTTNKKISALFTVGTFLILAFIFMVPRAQAATSTVRGIGWWGDNYQEVYFNCADDKYGDRLDDPSNLSGGGKYSPPNDKFHFYLNPCHDFVHGVYIDSNDRFSGQAWNPSVGFISFSGTSTPPDAYASTASPTYCPSTCNGSNNCWACYNETSQKIYGWARVDRDGTWIQLNNILAPSLALQNCDLTNSVFPGHSIQSGDFVGTASSSSGNLSFNCQSEIGGSTCGTRNYKVYVSNLTLGSLSAPNWSNSQACSSGALGATLKWCRRSGTQTAYEVVVNKTNTLSTSTAACWSGIKTSAIASQYNFPSSDCASLEYNKSYYWWVRLYDENGTPTDWYQYNTNSSSDTDGNADGNALTFQTYPHEFPSPYFTWSPFNVEVASTTIFTSASKYYTSGQPSNPMSCATPNCSYNWTTTDPFAIIGAPTNATTSIIFNLATGTTITLSIRDQDNNVCSTSSLLRINYGLPIWREIKAK